MLDLRDVTATHRIVRATGQRVDREVEIRAAASPAAVDQFLVQIHRDRVHAHAYSPGDERQQQQQQQQRTLNCNAP